jgi:putative flippase GtrA
MNPPVAWRLLLTGCRKEPRRNEEIMLRREFAIFLVVGSTSVLVDFFIYAGIVRGTDASVGIAKGSSFIIGTAFTYFANRFWTFGHSDHQSGSAWRYALLYTITLSTNIIVNSSSLWILRDTHLAVPLAFLTATGVSASLNFLGMKLFVFKPSAAPEAQ